VIAFSTSTPAANSDVSPSGLVEVALIASPTSTSGSSSVPNEKSSRQLLSLQKPEFVTTALTDPIQCAPSP